MIGIIKEIPLITEFAKFFFKKKYNPNSAIYWIDKYVKNANFNVVQIGSNDGITGDPIFLLALKNSNWKVLLVEPVPYLFEKLKNNYPDSNRFRFENVAINEGSKQVFYFVKKEAINELENLPAWYDQLGSFYKSNILKHLNGILEPYIQELEIQGITLDKLFNKNGVESLELLHIDTEGYDWKILSQLNLEKYNPTIILFEDKHLEEGSRNDAISFLEKDYNVFNFDGDFLCLRKDKIKRKDYFKLRERLKNPLVEKDR